MMKPTLTNVVQNGNFNYKTDDVMPHDKDACRWFHEPKNPKAWEDARCKHLRAYHDALITAQKTGCKDKKCFTFRDVLQSAASKKKVSSAGFTVIQTGAALPSFSDTTAYRQLYHVDSGRDGSISIGHALQHDVMLVPSNSTGNDKVEVYAGDVYAWTNTVVHAGASMPDLDGEPRGDMRRRIFCNFDRGDKAMGAYPGEDIMATEAEVQTLQEGWHSAYQCLVVEVPTLEAMFAMMEAALPATAMKLAPPLPKGALVGKDNEQGSAPK